MTNEEAIKLLDDWIKIPDDLGDKFWDEFMLELNEERVFCNGKRTGTATIRSKEVV